MSERNIKLTVHPNSSSVSGHVSKIKLGSRFDSSVLCCLFFVHAESETAGETETAARPETERKHKETKTDA